MLLNNEKGKKPTGMCIHQNESSEDYAEWKNQYLKIVHYDFVI